MIERRETSRRRVCFGGLVRVAAFLPEIACQLRDVSLDGARIRLPAGTPLPARFELHVPCRGQTRRARVVWRDGDMVGLGFEEVPPEASPRAGAMSAGDEAQHAASGASPGIASRGRSDRLH